MDYDYAKLKSKEVKTRISKMTDEEKKSPEGLQSASQLLSYQTWVKFHEDQAKPKKSKKSK